MGSKRSRYSLLATALSTGILLAQLAAAQSKLASPAAQPKIGGEPVVTLTRARTGDGTKPEFLSVTVLPGRAMEVFQITAWIPGKGEVSLLHSPSLEEAATILGGPDDPYGTKSFSFGGAFLAPFANRIIGPLSNGGKTVSFSWDGHPVKLVANFKGKKPGAVPHAIHGLMLAARADDVHVSSANGVKTVSGIVHGSNFSGRWFSKSNVKITVSLERDALLASVTVMNVGKDAEPVGIAWHPYFNILGGDRKQVRLYVPGDMRAQVNNYDDVFPTGTLEPVQGTPYDFARPGGAPLDSTYLDDNFSHLKRAPDGSSYAEFVDPAAKYGVRVTALTRHVNTYQIYSPPDQSFVVIEPQFNLNDPFGAEWKGKNNGMVIVAPGRSVTWKAKLGLFVP